MDLNFVEGDPFTLSTAGYPSLLEYESSDGTLNLSGLSINLIPAPGTGALLAIGALAVTRRRR
ncbi:MAG: PEP-CTERM sorting domain-containing protein [Phycisphaerales bacterium]